MRTSRCSTPILVFVFVLLVATVPVSGQDKAQPQIISWIEFQKPKAGMSKEYEEGRRAKAEWHRQQKDAWPLFVWEVISGEMTGQYLVGLFGREWKDFDAPVVSESANTREFQDRIAPYTESVTTRFYTYLPEVSRPGQFVVPSPLAEVRSFRLRYGKWSDFSVLLRQLHEAAEMSNWPVAYRWYSLKSGGYNPTFEMVIFRKNWADFGPTEKTPMQLIYGAYGPEETSAFLARLAEIVQSEETHILRYRADLSYVPEAPK